MKKITRKSITVMCGLLSCFLFIDLKAQEGQLLIIGALLIDQGYEITHDAKYASLYDDSYDNYYFSLKKGWSYVIAAACDEDCGDIDLCLFDENNIKIGCDQGIDDKPMVSVSPKWSGSFRLWIKMEDCDRNPCRFGIVVFGK